MSHLVLNKLHGLFKYGFIGVSGGFSAFLQAQEVASTVRVPVVAATTTASSGLGSTLQMVFGLLVVLGFIFALAWLIKRFDLNRPPGNGLAQIVGGVMLGQRERVVVIEVRDTWLVLGVTAQSIQTLHTLPKDESHTPMPVSTSSSSGFAQQLGQFIARRSPN
jgi:flagellar protein FliO/FliZ